MSLFFDNNKLFDTAGHLTEDGLRALKEGTLDELGSLEAAEHLTFCDACLMRYTALLEAAPDCLKTPMRDLVPQVQALMKLRSFRILTNRYVSAAAAVVLAFSLWRFGTWAAPPQPTVRELTPKTGISQLLRETVTGFSDGVSEAFGNFSATAQSGFSQLNHLGQTAQKGE